MRQFFLPGLALSALALAVLGCDSSTSGLTEPSGRGILVVTITAPSGVTPTVAVEGPAGYSRSLVASQTLTGLTAGSYTVTALAVEAFHPVVATLYEPTVTGGTAPVNKAQTKVSVSNGDTVTAAVSYAAQPGTGALWVTSGGTHLRAYSAAVLERSGTPAPAIDLLTGSAVPTAVAFDGIGHLWAAGNHGDGAPQWQILKYPVEQLGASANASPLNLASGAGNFQGMAFDPFGNLWVTDMGANTIVRFNQVASGGGGTSVTTLSATGGSINGPAGIAFDPNGNLWVANNTSNTVVEFGGSQLANSGSPEPIVTLSAASGSLDGPSGLVFDVSRNLWVTNRNANTVVEFGATQLGVSGSPTPLVTLRTTGGSLSGPSGVALDASGDLWVANDLGRSMVQFGASQLRTSGAPTPVVTLGGLGGSGPHGIAFDPPMAPLYPHSYDPWGY